MKSIFEKKMKNKKFKKLYDKLEKGHKDVEEGRVIEVGVGKTYKTVDAMLEDLDKNRTIFDRIRSAWYRYFWNFVSEIPLNVKTFIQRGFKGWAISDTWGFDYYLAKTISEGLRHLSKHAYRDTKWKKDMLKIARTFETAIQILENKRRYIPSKEFTWAEYKRTLRFSKQMTRKFHEKYRPMTLREAIRFEKGFDLFRENFFRLWD